MEDRCTNASGGRLTGDAILKYIQLSFNVDYHPNAIYKLLEQLGFNWITSRSKHPKQAIEAQTAFKKVPVGNDPYTNQYKNLLSSERFLAN
ncbi:helix-turn-helix domain-containing protein [Shewanella sairae]|uniref:helix-turn-helix domain-containing protein n=1 Tax=Shewanella sairae TaxID=190310 RepID=UPI001C80A3DB